ncbi:hypothetical protein EV2_032639 [Malus domestica]
MRSRRSTMTPINVTADHHSSMKLKPNGQSLELSHLSLHLVSALSINCNLEPPSLADLDEPNHQTTTIPCYSSLLLSSHREHQTQTWNLHCIVAIAIVHHLLQRVLVNSD